MTELVHNIASSLGLRAPQLRVEVVTCVDHAFTVIHNYINSSQPRKHVVFTQGCFNTGPASQTVAQHYNNIGSRALVYSETIDHIHQETFNQCRFTVSLAS